MLIFLFFSLLCLESINRYFFGLHPTYSSTTTVRSTLSSSPRIWQSRAIPPYSLCLTMADNKNNNNQEKPNVTDTIESPTTTKIPYWRLVVDQGIVTQEIIDYPYPGAGTEENPYCVTWIPNDPRNPMLFGNVKKWSITMLVAFATLAVALVSSAYTGGVAEIQADFGVGSEVATLGVSLFVVGFAIGKYY